MVAPARRSKIPWALWAGLGCTAIAAAASKPPEAPRLPARDYAEFERLLDERMGKVPIADAAVSADGVQVVFQTGHAFSITALALSHDGRQVLSGSQDETAKLWDVASGREIRTLSGFGSMGPRSVRFSADDAQLIVSDLQSTAVFDAATGRKLRSLTDLSMSNLVSADGRLGVDNQSATAARAPSVIDLATGQVIWTVPLAGSLDSQSAVTLSGDGNTLITRRIGPGRASMFTSRSPETTFELQVWDVGARKLRSKLPFVGDGSDGFNAMSLSPDGRVLAFENRDRSLSLYDLATAKELIRIRTGAAAIAGMTTTLLFSPDGARLAFATSEGPARIWEVPTGRSLATLDATALNFSDDGTSIVLGRRQGGAPVIRDLASGAETALTGGTTAIMDLTAAQGGRAVVAATISGSVNVWDLATAQLRRSVECPNAIAASSVSASSQDAVIAVGCMDGSAVLWDLDTGKKLRELLPPAGSGFVYSHVRFSRDGRRVAVAVGNVVTTFEAPTGRPLQRFELPPSARPAVLASQDEPIDPEFLKQLPASARKALEAQESSQQDANVSAVMEQNTDTIAALALHPGGRLIATGRMYETALWDAATGRLVRHFGGAAGAAAGDPLGGIAGMAGMTGMPDAASAAKLLESMRGGKGGLLGSMLGRGGKGATATVVMPDLAAMMRGQREQFNGASSLAFSDDGRMLLAVGTQGKRIWDVDTGDEISSGRPAPAFDPDNPRAMMDAMLGEEMGEARGTAVSADGRLLAHGIGRVIKITDVASGADIAQLVGHTGNVSALAFVADGRLLVSGGMDGALRVWTVADGKEAAALIALGRTDYVAVTPDQFYRTSKSHIKGVAFRVKDQLYPFEQFDLRFNRPDVVLQRLALAAPEEIQGYRRAYERRLRKMGFSESMLGTDFHLPSLAILSSELPMTTADSRLTLRVRADDDRYPLDRLNLFVNDVPISGTAGLPLATRGAQHIEQEITAPLIAGRNKLQVSVLNSQGTESLRQTIYVNSTADPGPADIYVVAIGVSTYQNSAYNLRYAAKDAGDVLDAYRTLEGRPAPRGKVHVLDLTNSKATRDGIRQARQFLQQARVNDLVVVFAAGHGMTDATQNYFFGTWDIDPAQPAVKGLPYEDFEGLLDGIPSLQKMLLLDTCFSGEIDKDEPTAMVAATAGSAGTVSMRAFKSQRGVTVVADAPDAAASPQTASLLRFQQDWFADLRRGTGAVVISSASGNEFALEGEQWRNGVFTYALLNGLRNGAADSSKDGVVTVGELQGYVIEEVRRLTDGGQNPTVRRENLDYDFAVF